MTPLFWKVEEAWDRFDVWTRQKCKWHYVIDPEKEKNISFHFQQGTILYISCKLTVTKFLIINAFRFPPSPPIETLFLYYPVWCSAACKFKSTFAGISPRLILSKSHGSTIVPCSLQTFKLNCSPSISYWYVPAETSPLKIQVKAFLQLWGRRQSQTIAVDLHPHGVTF